MITACWNVFMLPINIAFSAETNITSTIDKFVDWCFILDMIIVFRTTIIDKESGIEITRPKIIAINYLKGRFMIDFLSTVPLDSIAIVS